MRKKTDDSVSSLESPDEDFGTPEGQEESPNQENGNNEASPGGATPVSPNPQRRLYSSQGRKKNRTNVEEEVPYMNSLTERIIDLRHVNEEEEESGDTDSIDESDEMRELDEAAQESLRDRLLSFLEEGDPATNLSEGAAAQYVMKFGEELEYSWPKPPKDWKPAKRKDDEPEFKDVDNPGKWCKFTFCPKTLSKAKGGKKAGSYMYHSLPTGATPVPPDEEGKRRCGDWDFYYSGWTDPKP